MTDLVFKPYAMLVQWAQRLPRGCFWRGRGALWRRCLASLRFLTAAWAPGGLRDGPRWPGRGLLEGAVCLKPMGFRYVFHASCVGAHAFCAGWLRCVANVRCLKAAWAPDGFHEAPGWPWRGSSGAAQRVRNCDNYVFCSIVFSCLPRVLHLGACFLRLVARMSCQHVLLGSSVALDH